MKNLISALNAEAQKRMSDFVTDIDKVEKFDSWYYSELMPKGSKKQFNTISENREYLKARKQKQIQKQLHKELERINTVFNAPEMKSASVSIEWKKSATWGSNPRSEASVAYSDYSRNVYDSGSISGCGYDKESTAFARALNQSNSFLKALYELKDANIEKSNHELFGYGSGYGILPYLEGGVGVSCFYRIFEKIGFKMEHAASGKTFDFYTISKQSN